MKSNIVIVIFVLFLFVTDLNADISPVSIINSGLVTLDTCKIKMLSETVFVKLSKENAIVECTFNLKNLGDSISIDCAFPTIYDSWNEITYFLYSTFEVQINNIDLKHNEIFFYNFSSNLDEYKSKATTYDVYSNKNVTCFPWSYDTIPWYLWKMSFQKKEEKQVKVKYIAPHGSTKWDIYRYFRYFLHTGAGWAERIDTALVKLQIMDFSISSLDTIHPIGYNLDEQNKTVEWKFYNLEPTFFDNIYVEYSYRNSFFPVYGIKPNIITEFISDKKMNFSEISILPVVHHFHDYVIPVIDNFEILSLGFFRKSHDNFGIKLYPKFSLLKYNMSLSNGEKFNNPNATRFLVDLIDVGNNPYTDYYTKWASVGIKSEFLNYFDDVYLIPEFLLKFGYSSLKIDNNFFQVLNPEFKSTKNFFDCNFDLHLRFTLMRLTNISLTAGIKSNGKFYDDYLINTELYSKFQIIAYHNQRYWHYYTDNNYSDLIFNLFFELSSNRIFAKDSGLENDMLFYNQFRLGLELGWRKFIY